MASAREIFYSKTEKSIAVTMVCISFVLANYHAVTAYYTDWGSLSVTAITFISILAISGCFRYRWAKKNGYEARISNVLTVLDGLALFAYFFSFAAAHDLSLASPFKGPSTSLIFLYVAIQGIRLNRNSILVASNTAILSYTVSIFVMTYFNGVRVSMSYFDYITSDVLLYAAEFERLIYLIALSIVLVVCANHGSRLLDDLEDSKARAEAANRAKSNFLANMSHEIRTPMNGVMAIAELLRKTGLERRQRAYVDIIIKSGSSLLSIINDILDFSKLEAQKLELQVAPFSLRNAVEDVITLLAPRAKEKEIDLILRIQPNLPDSFSGDAGRLRQVLVNLVGNAIKFTDVGHVYLNIKGRETPGEASETSSTRYELLFEVIDSGCGIPTDQCETIFEEFSQVDTTTTRAHEGTGLGLPISAALVKLMGGEIGVQSQEGIGSTFRVAIELPQEMPVAEHSAPKALDGLHIMIIEPNELTRSNMVEQLDYWRIDCLGCENEEMAIQLADVAFSQNILIDALIIDGSMGGERLNDVVDQLRAKQGRRQIPVIVATDDYSSGGANSASSNGDDLILEITKPVRFTLLQEVLQDVVQSDIYYEKTAGRFAAA